MTDEYDLSLSEHSASLWERAWARVLESTVGDLTEERAPYPEFADDPNGFIREVLGERPWSKDDSRTGNPGQVEWGNALLEFLRVSICTGNGPGKTRWAAWIVLWFMSTRKGRCITIGPSHDQLTFELWGHIRDAHKNSAKPLPGDPRETFWKMGPRWHARAMSTDRETRVQGPHPDDNEDLLIVLEEASGIPEFVYSALDGFQTKGRTYIVEIGNPNATTGSFADRHDPDNPKESDYECFGGGAIDAPDWIISDEWIERMRAQYPDPDHPRYRIRVRGLPPLEGSEWQIFPRALLESCADLVPNEHDELHMGLDCARSNAGDYNVATLTRGEVVVAVEAWHSNDTMYTARNALMLAEAWGLTPRDAHHVHIDVIGIGGGVVDKFKEKGWRVDAVDYGGECKGEWRSLIGKDTKLANRKAELHYVARERLRARAVAIPKKFADTWTQLQWLEFEHVEGSEVFRVKPKKTLAKRGISGSPDYADSWILTHSRWRKRRRVGLIRG